MPQLFLFLQDSGLSLWLGEQLVKLDSVPTFVIVLITASMLCAFTEVTSNTATATIFLPILGTLVSKVSSNMFEAIFPVQMPKYGLYQTRFV